MIDRAAYDSVDSSIAAFRIIAIILAAVLECEQTESVDAVVRASLARLE
jgi:hypothetical protein